MWQQRYPSSGPDKRVTIGGHGDRPGRGCAPHHLRVEPPPRRQIRKLGNADPPAVLRGRHDDLGHLAPPQLGARQYLDRLTSRREPRPLAL